MKRVHFEINGLTNQEEKTAVKNALDKIEGVQMINVDIGRSTIEIGYNTPASSTQIIKCIEKTGFRVAED